jgi:hypothetical protein
LNEDPCASFGVPARTPALSLARRSRLARGLMAIALLLPVGTHLVRRHPQLQGVSRARDTGH